MGRPRGGVSIRRDRRLGRRLSRPRDIVVVLRWKWSVLQLGRMFVPFIIQTSYARVVDVMHEQRTSRNETSAEDRGTLDRVTRLKKVSYILMGSESVALTNKGVSAWVDSSIGEYPESPGDDIRRR